LSTTGSDSCAPSSLSRRASVAVSAAGGGGSSRGFAVARLDSVKEAIHPEYVEARVWCTCGHEFTTRSTKPELHVEICSNCHPFYTGRQKLVDTGGRVERFQRRAAKKRR